MRAARAEPPTGEAALLWLPGRNDAFYHPHVARLLLRHGIDLYVCSYRRMGVCRRLGLFANPMHNSHCASGDLSGGVDAAAAGRHGAAGTRVAALAGGLGAAATGGSAAGGSAAGARNAAGGRTDCSGTGVILGVGVWW